MDPKALQEELAARRRPGAVVRRLGGLKQMASMLTGGGVPRPVRSLLEDVFAQKEVLRWQRAQHHDEALAREFAAYQEADWPRTIETLVPHIAPAAVAACQALSDRPYQAGIARKPFRGPGSPQTISLLRGRWLLNITVMLGEYEADLPWLTERAGQIAGWWGGADIGWLLAGALNTGGRDGARVDEILRAAAAGEHPVADMGRHVTQAFLSAANPAGWDFVGRLLLAAQRQEGLRQAILESIDEAHPEAFRHMLRLIREENLTRFSATVRAADTWFGFMWDGASALKIDGVLDHVLRFLDDPAACAAALGESDAEVVYLALWATAFRDVDAAIGPATRLLDSPAVEVRFVATHFLVQALWSSAFPPVMRQLADPDLRVAARALDLFAAKAGPHLDHAQLFDAIEALLKRLPRRSQVLEPCVWPWWKRKLERPAVAAALAHHAGAVPGSRLLPYIPDLEPHARATFIRRAAGLSLRWELNPQGKPRALTGAERTVALTLLGDASVDVRAAAFEAMALGPLAADEVDRLIELLGRKPGDLRNGAITRLAALPDDQFLAAADRLLADGEELRRLAGLELLRAATESGRLTAEARARMQQYAADRPEITEQEEAHTTAVLDEAAPVAVRDDAFGLLDPGAVTPSPDARPRPVTLLTPAAEESLELLARLILSHQTHEVRGPDGQVRHLVEGASWSLGPRKPEDLVTGEAGLPLASTWKQWQRERPARLRDEDGCEFLRILVGNRQSSLWSRGAAKDLVALGEYGAGGRFLRGVLEWCIAWEPPAGGGDFLLDGLENQLAGFSADDLRAMQKEVAEGRVNVILWGEGARPHRTKLERAEEWRRLFNWWRGLFPRSVMPAQAGRLYHLLRHFQSRTGGHPSLRLTLDDVLGVYRAGAIREADWIDLLMGRWSHLPGRSLLREVSSRKATKALEDFPELTQLVERCRRRLVEVECQRGDRETAGSGLAMELRFTGGLETLSRAVPSLGKSHFVRNLGWTATSASRQDTLSHLVVRSAPGEGDTPERFAEWVRTARIGEARLVELAVYAPQWAAHVNQVLAWEGLESAVWWIEAHTKDDRSWQIEEMRQTWAAEVSERTPLSATDLTEGAVDVAWFTRVYAELGAERWKKLDAAAKYAASAGGHTRARLFAGAMSGSVTQDQVLERIDGTRHQDSVRALGLLPLPEGEARNRELLARYQRLDRFRRESRKFGSQRQQSEKRAVTIGLENLARTAGFRDPQRLQWAMEQAAVADLARGAVTLTRGDIGITLSVEADGNPVLGFSKGAKPLKALPASLKNDTEVAELKGRYQELKRQRSRVREALEEAMIRGDRFHAAELQELLAHPILAPGLARLVFAGEGQAGYLVEQGRALRDHAGQLHALSPREELRVAHPQDLFTRGDWSAWQRECYRTERVQPFKQVFRELYPLTESERGTTLSRRYAGHQVGPRQALALLGGRGWVARPEEGVSRTFHEEGLTARLTFQETFYTPADIEGLTLEAVHFTRKGEWAELPLEGIPPRLFSETMRDLDLVVSVAHQGGVDPEASASTVEMRGALVRETCELLGLTNVEIQPHHATITGQRARYSVHLGSGGVLILPGTVIPIVAVHSQHRGRLFLPFADDDPRTAEILSKVLLLARDKEIRDPTILEWIRAAT